MKEKIRYNAEKINWIYESRFLERTRLFERLDRDKHTQLVGIYGNSGFGKSCLLYSYLAKNRLPAVWYNIEKMKQCDETLIIDLRDRIFREIAERTAAEQLPQPEGNEVDDCLTDIEAGLDAYGGRFFIILDNYHMLQDDSGLIFLITQLLDLNITGLTMVIISHTPPEYSFLKLKAYRNYLIINENELRLTFQEIKQFFNEYHSHDLKEQDLKLIRDRIGGWATGCQLLSDYLYEQVKSEAETATFRDVVRNVPDIYNYFSEVIFNDQDEDTQMFLKRTSLLLDLKPTVINEYLGIDNAGDILSQLLKKHLFIERMSEEQNQYFLLFRQFLYYRYLEEDREAVLRDHKNLGDVFEGGGDYYNAYIHALLACDYPKAKRLMTLLVKRYGAGSVVTLLEGQLEETSNNMFSPEDNYYLISTITCDVFTEILPAMRERATLLKERHQIVDYISLALHMGDIFMALGELDEAIETYSDVAVRSASAADSRSAAYAYNLLIDCLKVKGDYEGAVKAAKEALYISRSEGYDQIYAQALDSLAQVYLETDSFEDAQRCIDEGVKIGDDFSLMWLLLTKADLLRKQGMPDESREMTYEAIRKGEHYAYDYVISKAYYIMALSHMDEEEYLLAEEELNQSEKYGKEYLIVQCALLHTSIRLFTLTGKRDRVKQCAAELEKLLEEKACSYLSARYSSDISESYICEAAPEKIRVQTLGRFKISWHGEDIIITRRSALRLLLYLLQNRTRCVNREEIIEAVFNEKGATVNNFNVVLSFLRKALDIPEIKDRYKTSILRFEDTYQLNTDCFAIDVDELYDLVYDGRTVSLSYERCLEAEKLYQGQYLEDYSYLEFVMEERERLTLLYDGIMTYLARYYSKHDNIFEAIEYYERLLKSDPFNEVIYYEYIELLLNQRTVYNARKVAHRMIENVENDLGVPVRGELEKLFRSHMFYL